MYKDECLSLGESFHQVACDIFPDDWLDNDNDDYHWFVPYVVNASFACELYLKALLFNEDNGPTQGHDLSKLYESLSEEVKNKVLKNPCFKGDNEFLKKLEDAKSLFCDWRYCFEHKKPINVDIIFLENLALVLHDIAECEVTHHDQL